MLNEIISNAYKYAFSDTDTGKILIKLTYDTDHITLSVSDNGKGMPEGFDIEKSSSLGMKLMKGIADQYDGLLAVTGNEWNGTTVSIKIKKGHVNE